MRPVTKVLLVLSVVALAGGVLYVASRCWNGKPPEKTAARSPGGQVPGERVPYNDPIATYERWRNHFAGRDGETSSESARPAERDLRSSSVNEGRAVAGRTDTPVAGADPPGPTLRPGSVEGEVVTGRWKTPGAGPGNTYVVISGDTLYGIALKHYGDPRYIHFIEAANPGIDARVLRVGEKIVLPERETREAKPGARETAAPQTKVYVVQRNDTLIGIARRFYGDSAMYRKIYEANQDILSSPNASLRVGVRLRLPESP